MYNPLVGAASEVEVRITKISDEWTVYQGVDVWENLALTRICEDFFICKAGIAPDVLSGFLFDAAGKFSKCLDLIERVASENSSALTISRSSSTDTCLPPLKSHD